MVALPNPTALALDARTGQVLVTSAVGQDGLLTALRAQSGTMLWTSQVGEEPDAIGVDEGAERLLVLNRKSATVSVLHAKDGRGSCILPVGEQPVAVAVDGLTHRAFVASAKQTVSILRLAC
jgi:serine/threonine-protein kinase